MKNAQQEVTYKGHTYKIGDFVHTVEYDCEHSYCYFGRIKSIELRDSGMSEEYNNTYHIEVLYTDYGYKFPEPFELTAVNATVKPAKEQLDWLIQKKQDEIKALTELYKEV